MPQCSYAVLDHYKTDLVSDSVPCLLLLAVKDRKEIGRFVVFITPNIGDLLDKMSGPHRSWMLGVLFDLDNQHRRGHIGNAEFEQFCSLGIGPLRTALHGLINIDIDEADGVNSIRDLICEKIGRQEQETDFSSYPGFLSLFRRLDPGILPQSDPPSSAVSSRGLSS